MATGNPAAPMVALAAIVAGGWLMTQYPEPAWIPVRAEVTRVSVMLSKGHRTQVVGLRTATGVGEARFTDMVVTCDIGDIVDAEQSGVAIRRSATTCT